MTIAPFPGPYTTRACQKLYKTVAPMALIDCLNRFFDDFRFPRQRDVFDTKIFTDKAAVCWQALKRLLGE